MYGNIKITAKRTAMTHLANLLHKIFYNRASTYTSRPENHSIRYGRNLPPIFQFFCRNFLVRYFDNHGSCFQINTPSSKFFFSKSCDSFVKPENPRDLQWKF